MWFQSTMCLKLRWYVAKRNGLKTPNREGLHIFYQVLGGQVIWTFLSRAVKKMTSTTSIEIWMISLLGKLQPLIVWETSLRQLLRWKSVVFSIKQLNSTLDEWQKKFSHPKILHKTITEFSVGLMNALSGYSSSIGNDCTAPSAELSEQLTVCCVYVLCLAPLWLRPYPISTLCSMSVAASRCILFQHKYLWLDPHQQYGARLITW